MRLSVSGRTCRHFLLVNEMGFIALDARALHSAAKIEVDSLEDPDCGIAIGCRPMLGLDMVKLLVRSCMMRGVESVEADNVVGN